MDFSNKKNLATISLIAILTISAFIAIFPAGAQFDISDGSTSIPTFLMLSAAPNPIGIGQTLYVNPFMTKPPLTGGFGGSGVTFEGIVVEVIVNAQIVHLALVPEERMPDRDRVDPLFRIVCPGLGITHDLARLVDPGRKTVRPSQCAQVTDDAPVVLADGPEEGVDRFVSSCSPPDHLVAVVHVGHLAGPTAEVIHRVHGPTVPEEALDCIVLPHGEFSIIVIVDSRVSDDMGIRDPVVVQVLTVVYVDGNGSCSSWKMVQRLDHSMIEIAKDRSPARIHDSVTVFVDGNRLRVGTHDTPQR